MLNPLVCRLHERAAVRIHRQLSRLLVQTLPQHLPSDAFLLGMSLELLQVVASLLLVVRPGALVASLLLVAMPGAPSSLLAPSSDARRP